MKKLKLFLFNIIASIIASVLVILFHKPLFRLFSNTWNWLQNASISIITGISVSITDQFYQICSNSYSRSDAAIITIWIGLILYLLFITANKLFDFVEPLREKLTFDDEIPLLSISLVRPLILKIVQFIFVILFIISTLTLMSSGKEYDDFHESLIVLSPYLNEKQEGDLRAMWVLMRNKADFDKIKAEVEDYSEQFDINLPNAANSADARSRAAD